ncbi:MAG: glycoside hydrolase family 3 C-terminal domain-containing protein, partial [Chitinophagaceae bacterium]
KAEYFDNPELKGQPVLVRTETAVDNAWQEGETIAGNLKANHFSARYTTHYTPGADDNITFEIEADDGYKLFVNDKEALNAWQRNRWGARTHRQSIQKGQQYKIVVEYWQGEGKANVTLRAGDFVRFDMDGLLTRIKDAEAIIYVGGISPQLEGEEMKVDYPGFNGGDRTSILLPAIQTAVMKRLKSTGRPVVFVMMTGSAIALPWESENIPAIVNAWYGGQSAGTAVADVLFGDYNPAGRLPVTFYKSDSDLPDFSSYDMTNRTYRYFTGEALYPFGYGLSYTTFHYDNLTAAASVTKGKKVLVSVRVKNTGKKDGEEVVQLYVSNPDKNIKAPLKALRGFKRIELKAGESKTITFRLSPGDLSIVSKNGELKQMTGELTVSVGGGQPGVKNRTTSNVVSKRIKIL